MVSSSRPLSPAAMSRALFLRRSLGLGAGLALGGSVLSACAAGDGDGAAGEAGSATATAEGGAASPSSAAAGGSIAFFGWDVADLSAGLGKGFAAVKEDWEAAEDGREVTFEGVPFGEFVAAATTRARSGDLGDVVEMLPGLNHSALFGALQSFSPADWGPLADELEGWTGGVVDPAEPDVVVGVPIGAQGVVWYYNRSLFEAADLDPDAPPTTWEDFTAACEALLESGAIPIGMSGVDSFLAWWAWSAFSPQLFPDTAEVLGIRSGEVAISDERNVAALRALQQTHDSGWWNPDFADLSFPDVEAAFGRGEIAMVPGLITSAMNWQVFDGTLGADAYGVFAAPLLPEGEAQGMFFNTTLIHGINADTENEAGARSWIEYLASVEGQTTMLEESGAFPNRADVDIEAVTGSAGAVRIRELVDELGGFDVIQNQFSPAAQTEAFQKLTQALTGGDVEQFLADLDRQQQQ